VRILHCLAFLYSCVMLIGLSGTCSATGYRYIPSEGRWDNTNVFPRWREKYPDPPDLVGMTRVYEK
jgi:hypothetical protein